MTAPTPSPSAPITSPGRFSVIGAGAWGTALASVLARNGHDVHLWARESEVAETLNRRHENTAFLPGVILPETIAAETDFASVANAQAVLMVAPAQHVREVLGLMKPHVAANLPVVLCSKGIEQKSGKLMTQVLADVLPEAMPAVLSGPSFARDVASGLPTAVTLAIADAKAGRALSRALGAPTFRVYWTDDLVGAELGGAVKNVMAIACGIVEGKKLGDSARAALIARGFAEIQRLAAALGAKPETLQGLSGLGDLILTCTSRQSRNMSLGVALGEGQSLEAIMAGRTSVAEGVHTAQAVVNLAAAHNVDMPVCQAVHAIVSGHWSVDDAIHHLLSRPMGTET